MDRTWILIDDRLSEKYLEGVESFIRVARNHLNEDNQCRCPCRKCVNRSLGKLQSIRAHLMRFGFTISYDVWVCHGEKESVPSTFLAGSSSREAVNEPISIEECRDEEDDIIRPLLEDLVGGGIVEDCSEDPSINIQSLFGDSTEKLYPGSKFSTLEAVVRLMHIKVLNRWSDKSFDMVLKFIKLMWPDLNNFPASTYDARRRLRDIGLGYEKIDACKYDCTLFWKGHANDDFCHVCKEPRYKLNGGKGKKIPHKSLRYFPLTPRLQRLFLSRHTAKDMRWHKDKRDDSTDALRHPADGEAWKHLDESYPQFADDARNVRLGLAADGFCPFSTSYSMWPVILVPYNMPPWKCMQQPFRMLSLLIPGPNSPTSVPFQTNAAHTTSQPATSQPSPTSSHDNTQKRSSGGRGRAKGDLLDYTILRYGKVKLVFDESLGRPNSADDNKFLIGECGKLARTHVPFRLPSFTAIDPGDYNTVIMRLQMKFVWDENCAIGRRCIYQALSKAYNTWKTSLGAKILKHSNPTDALQEKEPDISLDDWKWWMEYVHSAAYQDISKRNTQNRAKLSYAHRAGSKPFVFHEPSCSQATAGPLGFFALFKSTHYSEKKGWINEIAQKKYEDMRALVVESQSSPNGPISEYEAGQIVLGRKSGYVRGMGRSVMAPPKSSSLNNAQASKIKLLENELGEMQAKMKDQDEKMAKLFEMYEALQRDRNRNLDSPGVGHSRDDSHTPIEEDDPAYY